MNQSEAKQKFLTVCERWADLLITDGIKTTEAGQKITGSPEDLIPKIVYGENAKTAASDGVRQSLNFAMETADRDSECSSLVREAIYEARRKYVESEYALNQLVVSELPEAQRKVWLAAWQLINDVVDATNSSASAPKEETRNE